MYTEEKHQSTVKIAFSLSLRRCVPLPGLALASLCCRCSIQPTAAAAAAALRAAVSWVARTDVASERHATPVPTAVLRCALLRTLHQSLPRRPLLPTRAHKHTNNRKTAATRSVFALHCGPTGKSAHIASKWQVYHAMS